MYPGRKQYTPRNGIVVSAFSVAPFTLAHICLLCALVPAPETYTNAARGDCFTNSPARPIVRSYVTRLYSASFFPSDETPRQKKHASKPLRSTSLQLKKSRC